MNSPFAYIGGKSRLSKQIIAAIPDHKTYCEVFSGAAWVFFRKPISKVEVINDLDSDLVTFYRVVQNHLEEFLKQFKWLLTSREWFQDWKDQLEIRGLTDIQKAARYYYVQRLAFGGKVKHRSYGVQIDRSVPRINLLRLEEEMSSVHLRLAHVR
ncbi:MAG: DNA adenine methylase, partial [Proteobacteria bacterium]|nr:DNA adenine methylase [Desulfobacula sp.]MBU4133365.1 DNA adenine methylase [Pseudomonadota bacterium]